MTQPQQNQQGSPATPIRPAATTYDRGEFADGEWGVVDAAQLTPQERLDRKSTRLNSSHSQQSRMPSSA